MIMCLMTMEMKMLQIQMEYKCHKPKWFMNQAKIINISILWTFPTLQLHL